MMSGCFTIQRRVGGMGASVTEFRKGRIVAALTAAVVILAHILGVL